MISSLDIPIKISHPSCRVLMNHPQFYHCLPQSQDCVTLCFCSVTCKIMHLGYRFGIIRFIIANICETLRSWSTKGYGNIAVIALKISDWNIKSHYTGKRNAKTKTLSLTFSLHAALSLCREYSALILQIATGIWSFMLVRHALGSSVI